MAICSTFKRLAILVAVSCIGFPKMGISADDRHGILTLTTLPNQVGDIATSRQVDSYGKQVRSAQNSMIVAARANNSRWLEIGITGPLVGYVLPHGYRETRRYKEPCPAADFEYKLSPDGDLGICPLGFYYRIIKPLPKGSGSGIVVFDPATGRMKRTVFITDGVANGGLYSDAFIDRGHAALLLSDIGCTVPRSVAQVLRIYVISLKDGSIYRGGCATGIIGYGNGHLAKLWSVTEQSQFQLDAAARQDGDLLAVTDDGTPITLRDGTIAGFGHGIRSSDRMMTSWSR